MENRFQTKARHAGQEIAASAFMAIVLVVALYAEDSRHLVSNTWNVLIAALGSLW